MDFPAEFRFQRRRDFLQEWTGDEHARSGDLTALDPFLDCDDVVERRAEVTRGRDAGHQKLFCGDRHDDIAILRRVGLEPVVVIAVAEDHEVDVHVHEAGHHRVAVGVDDFGAGRNLHGRFRTDRADGVAFDDHDRVLDRRSAVTVDQTAAREDERLRVE